MFTESHVNELLPAHALGCLDEEDTVVVSEHLAVCPECRAELQTYEPVADELSLAAPDAVPSEHLKRAVMDRVGSSRSTAPGEPRPSWWKQVASVVRSGGFAWGVAGLAVVAVLVTGSLLLLNVITRPVGMQTIALAGTDAVPGAIGTIVISSDARDGTLVVDGLPSLDDAHQYQLWLIRDGERTSGAVFSVKPDGYGSLWIEGPQPLSSYDAFGVTIEPAGGSPGPTGEKVLGGHS